MAIPGSDMRAPHLLSVREVAAHWQSDLARGLSRDQAITRLREIGRNVIDQKEHWLARAVFRRVGNTLTLILLAAVVLSWLLGDVADAVVIGVVVGLDVIVGLVYESYTRYRIDLIRKQVPRIAEVVRDGVARLVPVEEVVPGDLVVLRRGERVPADARVTASHGVRVDEAVLTGEPGDTAKTVTTLSVPAATADQRNMVFLGTLVTTGGGQALAVATGARSLLGSLARRVMEAGWQVTPLEMRLRHVGQLVGAGIFVVAALLFTLGLLRGEAPAAMFRATLTLAVAAIPEDLTFLLTIALAVGATRLLPHRAVVRHLAAAETLGDVTVVASDKTGTLTTGELALRRVEGVAETWGSAGFHSAAARPLFRQALVGAVVGTDAGTSEDAPRGSALERALRAGVRAAGINPADLRREYPLYAVLAFDPKVRYHVSLHADPASQGTVLFAVGAPDALLPRSVAASDGDRNVLLTETFRNGLLERAAGAASSGVRVLAVCMRHSGLAQRTLEHTDIKNLTFLAFLCFEDPVRPDAADAVAGLQRAGVRVLLMTGDHHGTATAVARATGILPSTDMATVQSVEDVLDGTTVERRSDTLLTESLLRARVVARVDPLQKERIVSVLQQRGEIVAMIGDGVNDAVALRRADLGVAVANATDVAKDASDLILLDGGLRVLTAALWEGRRVRETVRTVLAYLFSTNITELLAVATCLLLGLPLPFLPAQLLWVNVVTDGTADVALALEPASTRPGDARPGWKRGLFRARDLLGMVFTGLALLVPTMAAYLLFLRDGDVAHARTAAFVTMAAGQLFSAFAYRSLERPLLQLSFFSNPWLLAAELLSFGLLVAAVNWAPLVALIGTTPLTGHEWSAVLALAVLGAIGVELRKVVIPHFLARNPLSRGPA